MEKRIYLSPVIKVVEMEVLSVCAWSYNKGNRNGGEVRVVSDLDGGDPGLGAAPSRIWFEDTNEE